MRDGNNGPTSQVPWGLAGLWPQDIAAARQLATRHRTSSLLIRGSVAQMTDPELQCPRRAGVFKRQTGFGLRDRACLVAGHVVLVGRATPLVCGADVFPSHPHLLRRAAGKKMLGYEQKHEAGPRRSHRWPASRDAAVLEEMGHLLERTMIAEDVFSQDASPARARRVDGWLVSGYGSSIGCAHRRLW